MHTRLLALLGLATLLSAVAPAYAQDAAAPAPPVQGAPEQPAPVTEASSLRP